MYIQRCVFLLLCTMLDTSCAALSVWILTERVCLSDKYQQVEDRQVLSSHVWVMKTIWRIYQESPRQKYLFSRASIWIKCRRKIRMLFNVEHNVDLFHQNSLIQDQFSLIGIKGGIMKYFFIFYHEKNIKSDETHVSVGSVKILSARKAFNSSDFNSKMFHFWDLSISVH